MSIHPTAVVDPGVTVGAGTTVGAHAVLEGPATFGEGNRIHPHAALGGAPQDLKYRGEPTTLVVGNRNVFREFSTAHRGTATGHGRTVIGDENLFMAYAHVAHDCVIGSRTVFANYAGLAGHCTVEDDAILGAYVGVRQFLRIGRHAFLGAFTAVNRDVLPFCWTSGDRDARAWKVNSVGLSRKGYSDERIRALQKAYRALHRHRHDHAALLAALADLGAASPDVKFLHDFIAGSTQGIHGA